MGQQKKGRKVGRATRPKSFDKPSDRNWASHMELFNHLVAAGPTMHGPQGERPKRAH